MLSLGGHREEAAEELAELIGLEPRGGEAHFALATLLMELNRPEEALERYRPGLEVETSATLNGMAHPEMGKLLLEMGSA